MKITKEHKEKVYCPVCKKLMEMVFYYSDPKSGIQYRCKPCKIQSEILEWGETPPWEVKAVPWRGRK